MRLEPMPFAERLAAIANAAGPDKCWNWPGFCFDGYGKVGANLDARGHRVWFAHRAAYTLLVGPVDPALELDHLCRNRRCMNPTHLEPVTPRLNTLRSNGPAGANARKLACVRGHPLTPGNIYTHVGENGVVHRQCRVCAREDGLAAGRRRRSYARGEKPACKRGHPLTADNIQRHQSDRRRCLTCQRAGDARRQRERRAKQRQHAK